MQTEYETEVKNSVLIVDDDPLSIFLSEKLLKDNYEVKSVANGHNAVLEGEQKAFDIILMDINLGDLNMDGIRTMKMMRRQGLSKNAFIVALTAFSHSKKWYIDQGFDDLFIKPLTRETLAAIDLQLPNKTYRKAF
jgi:two-component system alkaline phosphatase synthesis response regulator PhoP